MKRVATIDFACNDPDNGIFAGRAGSATYGDIELEAPNHGGFCFTVLSGPVEAIRIHRQMFRITGSREWFGNWCWNRYELTRGDMKRLLRTLRENGWRVTCGPSRFYRWWNGEQAA